MTVEAAQFQLGRGILNSIITYFGADSLDVITPDGLPEESVEFLRAMLNHYSDKDARLAQAKNNPDFTRNLENYYETGLLSYSMLNGFGGLNNLYNMKEENDEAAASLKYILGQFTVKPVTENGIEGYRIYDKYDFKNNEDYFISILPEIYHIAKERGYDTSAVDGQLYMTLKSIDKNLAKPNRSMLKAIAHPIARTLGGWFIGEDRPEEDKIKIDFFIPKNKTEPPMEEDTVMPVRYYEERAGMPEAMPKMRPENFAAYIPNGPMDTTRQSAFNKFMDMIIPKAEAASIEEPKDVMTPFQTAFAEARARGDSTFEFTRKDGITRTYTTEVADG